jgi:hypothetical protein
MVVASGRITPGDVDLPPSVQFFSKPYDLNLIISRFEAMARKFEAPSPTGRAVGLNDD